METDQTMELPVESAALVIVTMQVEGCERHGPTMKPVIENTRSLLTKFREANGRVIYIQSTRSKDAAEFTFFKRKHTYLENTPGIEFVDELKPLANEPVVKKATHDSFYQTTLQSTLDRLDIRPCRDTVVAVGIASDICLYQAVIGFHVRNYITVVPEDCIHAKRPEGDEFALSHFRSSTYNFNVTVSRSDKIKILQRRSVAAVG
jgi:nicotinamidase-related amidase